ncbi:pentapeptide repeat-containing protein [Streptomyces sp. NPDC059534]|uniref:pentapeptide repeat-containing protein n=1 Tax=Streptomyces sp. NPDC059534 TaxID=3346859 RepID=UPI0036ACC013
MPSSNSVPLPTPPLWPHCAHGSSPQDPVGCPGIHVPGHTACLAHLADADRNAYLAGLAPGSSIDHSGTTFTAPLLDGLLNAFRDPATSRPRLGNAVFRQATFEGDAEFEAAHFEDDVSFAGATFKATADFRLAVFNRVVDFGSAIFEYIAAFGGVGFDDDVSFARATFESDAGFRDMRFKGFAGFQASSFNRFAEFRAVFESDAVFKSATFRLSASFGPSTFQGEANFERATFENNAWFREATFEKDAIFYEASFKQDAVFAATTFKGRAEFSGTTFGSADFSSGIFEESGSFGRATFRGFAEFSERRFEVADFGNATFEDSVNFSKVTFEKYAHFDRATFKGTVAIFERAICEGEITFYAAVFEQAATLGPLLCANQITLSRAVFGGPVTLSFAARHLKCQRTRWTSTAEIRLRHTTVDFADAVFEYPLTIAAEADPFSLPNRPQAEQTLFGTAADPSVRVVSLRGVDAAHLVLADIDLSKCLFTGTVHLDQVRLEGACSFATVPSGRHWRRWRPVQFTQRRTLAEEHHWRARQPAAVPGWNGAGLGARHVGPLQLAPVYRALRKAFEDGKHEPGAADFYYGEMEMRRHADDIPRSERRLLTAYWAMSGYGLRASRALGWLAVTMLATIVLMMGFGLPQDDPKQQVTGTVPAGGGKVTFEIDRDDPQNPTGNRFTGKRFEKAVTVTLNSVVFRSSGQDLTTAGTYIEMTSRVTEPILLGLAVLAVRNRVKR